jgi:hypothetical protein
MEHLHIYGVLWCVEAQKKTLQTTVNKFPTSEQLERKL